MEKYLVYLYLNEPCSHIICDTMADAEELVLTLAQSRMYENYCWYICNNFDYYLPTNQLQKKFHTETLYGACLLKEGLPIRIVSTFIY